MSGSYNKIQNIHSFSFSVNSAEGITFYPSGRQSAFEVMQKYVTKVSRDILKNAQVQGYIGSDWKPVWGPIVWSKDQNNTTAHSDNTMGAYYSPSQKLFVVAVAGTNPISSYGWIDEDFDVLTTVEWNDVTGKGSGSISQGTYTGLNILLNMTDPSQKNKTLLVALKDFVKSNSINHAEIAVAGHSLGGALSPTLALYLSDKKSEWDPNDGIHVSTFPTAGPTPGNETFANYYEDQINERKITYLSLYNPIDCVPQAWVIDNLASIPKLYEDHIPSDENPVISTLVTGAAMASIDGAHYNNFLFDYYKQVTPFQALRGASFDTSIDNIVKDKLKWYYKYLLPSSLEPYFQDLVNVVRFAAQAAVQHTSAYDELLNITDFMTEYKAIVAQDTPTQSDIRYPINEAIKRAIKVDLKLKI
ncbi:MAG: hypothetical protein AAGA77_07630 [Bacteroidota bacterium]